MDFLITILAATTKTATNSSNSFDMGDLILILLFNPISLLIIGVIIISIIAEAASSKKDTTNTTRTYSQNHSELRNTQVKTPPQAPLSSPKPAMKKTTGLKTEVKSIDDIKLGEEQKRIFTLMNETNDNLFITGKAGTGKSVLLQYFVRHTSKQVAVVAPTGVAALNVGGQTIHSFFKMDLEIQDPDDRSQVEDMGYKRREILAGVQTLIIDEISMVSADIMDMIDAKLKFARENNEPFGGCQIIVFGDLYQLPPVVPSGQASRYMEDRYKTIYYFGATEIQKHPFKIIELQHVFRQKDETFIEILNKIRLGKSSNTLLDDINSCCVLPPKDEQYITLTGDNATADGINRKKLDALPTKEFVYTGAVEGDIKQSSMPTDLHLHLKVGAHVMMIKNDRTDNSSNDKRQKARWVNGTLGIISELKDDGIKVKINGVSHWIDREEWSKYQYRYNASTKKLEKDKVATFTQYPIKLAYAITIHKSQGQTYDAIKVDLSKGAFAPGQAYVALSRCKTMEALYLATPLKLEDIKVSQEVVNYMSGRIVQPAHKTSSYKIHDVKQRSEKWDELRGGKVTGTCAIFLKNHLVDYVIRKSEELELKTFENEAMIRGRKLEPVGISKFARQKGLSVESVGFVESKTHDAAGFSPDGVIYGDDGKIKTIIEHKAFGSAHHFACYECIDEKVMYQIQFGLFVTGAEDAYLVLYNPDIYDTKSQLLSRHIEKDDKIQAIFESRFEEYENGETELTATSMRVERIGGGGGWNKEAILQYDDNGKIIAEFESMSEASEKTGIGYYSIRDAVSGRQNHAGGFGWIYKRDYSSGKTDLATRSKGKRPAMIPIPVLQCDDNGNIIAEFESISQAERETSASSTCIYKALHGEQQRAGGFCWKYKNGSND